MIPVAASSPVILSGDLLISQQLDLCILMSLLEPAASCLQPSLACEEMCQGLGSKMGPGAFLAPCPSCVWNWGWGRGVKACSGQSSSPGAGQKESWAL